MGVKSLASYAYSILVRNIQYFEPRFLPFGMAAVVGFPCFYLVWHYIFPQPYESLVLRLIGSAVFVPIIFAKRWPTRLQRFLPAYWYLAILYALPFFFTFMLLKNAGSSTWVLSALSAVFLMVLLLDWVNLFIQFFLGVGLAWLAYCMTTQAPSIGFLTLEHVPIFLFIVILGALANYNSQVVKHERMRAMLIAASTVAHELRTPLLGIKAGAAGLKRHLPALLDAYRQASQAKLPVSPIRGAYLDSMAGVLERIESEVDCSNTAIDILLMNTRTFDINEIELSACSIRACVEAALRRYPFSSERERALVTWEGGDEFTFWGNELLAVHVLFNLLKNAVYHVAKAGKGQICIRLRRGSDQGHLIFRDTGPGIPPHVLSHIFTRFYSWSGAHNNGSRAGIGLAYCRSVMQAFGGTITCKSVAGEYSEFVLTFPVVNG